MNKVNFKKVVCAVSLGTAMVLGSMSSAFAADINHLAAQAKTVELHQQLMSTASQGHRIEAI